MSAADLALLERISLIDPMVRVWSNLHQGSNNDQRSTSGIWRDRGEDGSKEDCDEEAEAADNSGESGLATFGNTGTRFDECSDRRRAKQGTDGDTNGINQIGYSRTFEILSLFIDGSGKSSHGVQCTSAICRMSLAYGGVGWEETESLLTQDIDVEEGDKGEAKLTTIL